MRRFEFNEDKNILLNKRRGISFEEVIEAVKNGDFIQDIKNPKAKYAHQRMYVIKIKEYIYAVPYVEDKRGFIFLKTIYPSRKLTRQYLKQYEK